ncbi:MAG: hypothetical protein MHPSP_000643, partial [Paramarteilia canceri]
MTHPRNKTGLDKHRAMKIFLYGWTFDDSFNLYEIFRACILLLFVIFTFEDSDVPILLRLNLVILNYRFLSLLALYAMTKTFFHWLLKKLLKRGWKVKKILTPALIMFSLMYTAILAHHMLTIDEDNMRDYLQIYKMKPYLDFSYYTDSEYIYIGYKTAQRDFQELHQFYIPIFCLMLLDVIVDTFKTVEYTEPVNAELDQKELNSKNSQSDLSLKEVTKHHKLLPKLSIFYIGIALSIASPIFSITANESFAYSYMIIFYVVSLAFIILFSCLKICFPTLLHKLSV